ncbi:ABC transporter ATP-binding protein [Muricauda sp. CAU 1633]|uniref:ABC transporter ATP-binding protein n=1 Tax=Allomuricauda sp. CAU 1633 TaxID=2816036 RepID=UPI001A8E19D2|nr:ABC transporter ATP-binding protein [Muricauda sp. CAU 1633]MBO0324273.1 ABC transporter ATP-binding protein [Muricauda sp. CAU 1633]
MKLVLETKNINKHFYKPKDFHVLKDISFGVKEGEFASIMGKSGSGKSTLLYVLSTMDTDYTGELYLGNELITGKSHQELSRIRNKHIGFVFQFHYLLSEFSVLENVMLPAKKLGEKSHVQIEQNAREKLEMLHIGHLAEQRASRISGGEKQRVAIARALINDPTILMGDEPTGNLDSHNSENVFTIFKNLKENQGLSLLVVTHDEDFAKRTDRIIEMEDGKIFKQ